MARGSDGPCEQVRPLPLTLPLAITGEEPAATDGEEAFGKTKQASRLGSTGGRYTKRGRFRARRRRRNDCRRQSEVQSAPSPDAA